MKRWPFVMLVGAWLIQWVVGIVDPGYVSGVLLIAFGLLVLALVKGWRWSRWLLLLLAVLELYTVWVLRGEGGLSVGEAIVTACCIVQVIALSFPLRTKGDRAQPRFTRSSG